MIDLYKNLTQYLFELHSLLQARNSTASEYFKSVARDINAGSAEQRQNSLSNLVSGYSIVQYANFTSEEEMIYEQIWMEAKKLMSLGGS
jgi:hypothetical protein